MIINTRYPWATPTVDQQPSAFYQATQHSAPTLLLLQNTPGQYTSLIMQQQPHHTQQPQQLFMQQPSPPQQVYTGEKPPAQVYYQVKSTIAMNWLSIMTMFRLYFSSHKPCRPWWSFQVAVATGMRRTYPWTQMVANGATGYATVALTSVHVSSVLLTSSHSIAPSSWTIYFPL